MSQLDPLKAYTKMQYGQRVDKAGVQLTGGGAAQTLFTITGGRVIIRAIVGEIEAAASGATNIQLQSNPDTGTTAVMCAVLAAAGKEVGTLLCITGAVAGAMYGVSAGLAQGQTQDQILPAGTIEFTSSAAETITVKWSVFYVPLDDGASVVAA